MMKLFAQVLVLILGAQGAFGQAPDSALPANRPSQDTTLLSPAVSAFTNTTLSAASPVLAVVSPGGATNAEAKFVASDGTVIGFVIDDKHKLVPGDKLSFQILEDREPQPKSLLVTDSGELDVPYLGRLGVLGRTCKQLGEDIKTLLEKDYYYRATVMIGLDQVSRTLGRIYIWGQVRNQGFVEIPVGEKFTAGKAILRAGGFGDFANKKKVKLVRTNADGQKQNIELNMVTILEDGKTELDVPLQADDLIIVPPRLLNW